MIIREWRGRATKSNAILQPAPIGYVTPDLRGSYVPIKTTHKIVVLDAGTSIFWRARADFEQREKRLLVEMIDLMFGQVCFAQQVKMDRSLSLKEIIAMGDVLAVLFAHYVQEPTQGLDGMEAALDELDYVQRNISPFLSAALRDGGKASARRRNLIW
jgi:hypothetical protein